MATNILRLLGLQNKTEDLENFYYKNVQRSKYLVDKICGFVGHTTERIREYAAPSVEVVEIDKTENENPYKVIQDKKAEILERLESLITDEKMEEILKAVDDGKQTDTINLLYIQAKEKLDSSEEKKLDKINAIYHAASELYKTYRISSSDKDILRDDYQSLLLEIKNSKDGISPYVYFDSIFYTLNNFGTDIVNAFESKGIEEEGILVTSILYDIVLNERPDILIIPDIVKRIKEYIEHPKQHV
jgi:hypothetical protein